MRRSLKGDAVGSMMLEPAVTLSTSAFHERATFCGVWLLVVLVGVHTMAAMRTILEPLLWAFFIMMGLLPITDLIESLILWCCGMLPLKRLLGSRRSAKRVAEERSELESLSPTDAEAALPTDSDASSEEAYASHDSEGGCCQQGCTGCGCARTVAVMVVITGFVGVVLLFFLMIYQSAGHMKRQWQYYEDGAQRISDKIDRLAADMKDNIPDHVVKHIAKQAVDGMEGVLSFFLGTIVENVTGTLFEVLMTLLYMVFWLCEPVHIGKNITGVFKQYILLKTLASASYAACIWLLLHVLSTDLSIVFGLITFLFNFVPEVGPFFAMLLPVPVILFDGRLEQPLLVAGVALGGQLVLKFIFGNIVEVKLVESQNEMKMHPVIILFFVAFFGWIWGATGMLLSVPLVAAAKATLHVVPDTYRDPILIVLEGDIQAPARYRRNNAAGTP